MLTERIIRDAKTTGKTYTLWDGKVKRLGMQVTRGGRRNYVLRYKTGTRWRQTILARCEEMSLQAARDKAAVELVRIRDGEPDPLERQRKVREAPTVADGLDQFFNDYGPERVEIGRMAPVTLREYRNQANRYVHPAIGNLRIAEVKRADIERMVARLPRVQRNRVLALASRLFNLFEVWEWRPQYSNPCRGVERAREEPRDRVLTASELSALAKALKGAVERHPGPVAAIRFASVTGLRIGEVLGIQWAHIDFQGGRVTLPETKTGRRVHDLPSAALLILAALPRINEWAFTTGRGRLGYAHCRKVFIEVTNAAGLGDVRLHDLRRTVMTQAAMAGVGTHVLRDLLGHKTTAMADRYVRALGNPVREAREQVGATIAAMMEGGSAAVVPLKKNN